MATTARLIATSSTRPMASITQYMVFMSTALGECALWGPRRASKAA